MISTQTTTILKWLANLSCALEDHQAFCEGDEPALADVSRGHAATAIDGIRVALQQVERSLDLVGGSPAGGEPSTARASTTALFDPARGVSRPKEAA